MHRQPDAVVNRPLRLLHFHDVEDFGFRRQFGGDFGLGAAKHERTHALVEHRLTLDVAVFLDRIAVAGAEATLRPEEARREEIEQRPQFAQMILQRRAGQAQALTGFQTQRLAGGFGIGVLDGLRLVQDHGVPLARHQHFMIARQQRIRGQNEVVILDMPEAFLPRGPCSASTRKIGANFSASIDQFGIKLVGHTISAGLVSRPVACSIKR